MENERKNIYPSGIHFAFVINSKTKIDFSLQIMINQTFDDHFPKTGLIKSSNFINFTEFQMIFNQNYISNSTYRKKTIISTTLSINLSCYIWYRLAVTQT